MHERQQTVRQLHLFPNCLFEHPKRQCNTKNRCQIDNCNGFHHTTIHHNNFNTTQPTNQGQKQSTSDISTYRHNGDNLNRNQFNFTNNSSSWNKNLSSTNPNYNHQTRRNGNSSYNRQRSRSRYNSNNNNNNNKNNYNNINSNNNTNGNNNNSNNYNRHNRNSYYEKLHQVPNTSNFRQQQPTSGNLNQQNQHSANQNSQSFSGRNSRLQNYTCSNNQPSNWIRPHVQLKAITVTVFSETVSIETYALLDSGNDNTQITRTIAYALGISDRKSVTIPVASLYQEHRIKTTEIFFGIDSSRPIIKLPVFATSTTVFQMPTVPIQMLNSVCKDFGHLSGINFSQIRDNRIGILIGADAFTATASLKYTIGPPWTPYGVLTQSGWTITGPVPNKYRQLTEKNICNRNITLFNRVKSEETIMDKDMLQFVWTCEGTSTTKASPNTINQEDKKALQIFEDTVKHNGERYENGLTLETKHTITWKLLSSKSPTTIIGKPPQWRQRVSRHLQQLNSERHCKKIRWGDEPRTFPTCNQLWHFPH